MRVSLDRNGVPYTMNEHGYRGAASVGETDNSVGNPTQMAEKFRAHARAEEGKRKKDEKKQIAEIKAQRAKDKALAAKVVDIEEYVRARDTEANDGEHPLMYLAALQSMSGTPQDWDSVLSGHGLSIDGQPAFDRGLGFSFSDPLASLQQAAEGFIQNTLNTVVGPSPAEIEAARQAAYAKALAVAQAQATAQQAAAAAAKPATAGKGLMDMLGPKVGGVPVIPVAVGVGLIALLVMRRK